MQMHIDLEEHLFIWKAVVIVNKGVCVSLTSQIIYLSINLNS